MAIFGHSWGSLLGVLYAARFPRKVAAYVGSGQIGDWPAAEETSYAFALGEAQRLGKRNAVSRLRAIGPPPYPAKAVFTERTWVTRLEGGMRPRALWKVGRAILSGQESSIFELPRGWRGFRWTMDVTWEEVSRLNLIERVPALQLPVFLFLGRRDHFVPPETSVAYFEALTAPSKKLVWFEDSGHEPSSTSQTSSTPQRQGWFGHRCTRTFGHRCTRTCPDVGRDGRGKRPGTANPGGAAAATRWRRWQAKRHLSLAGHLDSIATSGRLPLVDEPPDRPG